jgi:hypothetical protein
MQETLIEELEQVEFRVEGGEVEEGLSIQVRKNANYF